MTKQILAFLFCFTRELNPYSPLILPLRARTENPHRPRELKPFTPPLPSPSPSARELKPFTSPLPSPSAHPWCQDLSKKFHYNTQRCNYKTNSSESIKRRRQYTDV